MEPIFQNRYVRDEKTSKELYQYFFYKWPLYIVLDILVAGSLLYSIYDTILNNRLFVGVVLAPVFYFMQFFVCSKTYKLQIKRDKEVNGGKLVEVLTDVTEESVKCTTSTDSTNEITYSNIKKVAQTKNLILLWTKSNLAFAFRKDSFTKGTPEEFKAFLRSKGYKIK